MECRGGYLVKSNYRVQGKAIMNREGTSPLPQAKMYHIRQPHKGLDGRFVNRPYGVRGMEGITIRRTVEDAGPYRVLGSGGGRPAPYRG